MTVPRDVALRFGVVSASALITGLTEDASVSTVSGDVVIDNVYGDLQLNGVSGEISVRNHYGKIKAKTISGDITAAGQIMGFTGETVSGDIFLDVTGTPDEIRASTVSGNVTARLESGVPAQYKINTVSGRLQLDNSEITRPARRLHRQVRRPRQALARAARQHRLGQHLGAAQGGRVTPVFAHGHLRLYLLSILATADPGMHGYELIQALGDRFGGTYSPSAGTIYPRLAKLEEEGLVTKVSTDGAAHRLRDHGCRPRRARRPRG